MSSSRDMSFSARALWVLCRAVAALPRKVQYGCLGSVVYFVMRYVVRYRRTLIINQLRKSFPERREAEILAICNDYYHTLAETIVGTMTLAGMSREEQLAALDITIPQHVLDIANTNHFVYLSSHHNFWEFAQFSGLKFENHYTLFAYHPLSNKVWEELFFHLRRGVTALPIPSSQFIRYFLEHKESGVDGRKMLLGLIADQNAAPKGEVHWYNFLNHPTIFFEGGEQLALKFHLPVLYLGMSRVEAGRYKGEVTLLYDGKEEVAKHEITERYVRQLEKDILREPSRWMWSHRRWKFYPDPETGELRHSRDNY